MTRQGGSPSVVEAHVPDVALHVKQGGDFWHYWTQGIAVRQEIIIVFFCFQEFSCQREEGRSYLKAVWVENILEFRVLGGGDVGHLLEEGGEGLRVVSDELGQVVLGEKAVCCLCFKKGLFVIDEMF